MKVELVTQSQKIRKAQGKVTKSLDVFRKAYAGVEVAIGDLQGVVEASDQNIFDLQKKIQEENATRLLASAEIENNKQLLQKFSEFLPLTSPKE